MKQSLDRALAYLGEKGQAGVLLEQGEASGDAVAPDREDPHAPKLKNGAVKYLAMRLNVSQGAILTLADIPEHTYSRRRSRHQFLTEAQSGRLLRIARVACQAEDVFGDLHKSRRWLTTKNRLLGAVPLELLGLDSGTREVEEELTRINFGDFA